MGQKSINLDLSGVVVDPVRRRYDERAEGSPDVMVVGADAVAPRHEAARRRPQLALIGSTDHYLTLTSAHGLDDGGCPACLHQRDDGVLGAVPTASFVSFAAGMEMARAFADPLAGSRYRLQQTRLRPDLELGVRSGPIPLNPHCPVPEAHPV